MARTCTTITLDWTVFPSPGDAMPSNRPNLTLDQQFFQELLSAAYTIQQHNDQLDKSENQNELQTQDQPDPMTEASSTASESQPTNVCPQCGAKLTEGAPCEHCSQEQLRPGERMQRKWASMWLMSQQQGLWPETSGEEVDQLAPNERPPFEVKRRPRPATTSDLAASGILSAPVESESGREKIGSEDGGAVRDRQNGDRLNGDHQNGNRQKGNRRIVDHENGAHKNGNRKNGGSSLNRQNANSILSKSVVDDKPVSNWNLGETNNTGSEDLLEQSLPSGKLEDSDSDSVAPGFHASDDFFLADTNSAETSTATEDAMDAGLIDVAPDESDGGESMLHRAADWRVRLRFHRADLYLGVAIFVAATALLWPTAGAQQPTLSLWQRTLVTLGVAEVQPPAVHLLGDPAIEVWIDPHSALYYCPGEEQYGKTSDGRFTSQREAQSDRFEPAGRSACE
jgi:hypothetical protein